MIHIAILLKPYLDMILDGSKTVECRLTVQARAPFEMIEPGERIYFKQSAGPFRAVAAAEHVLCEGDITRKRLAQIKRDYNHLIRGDAAFWRNKAGSNFVTLIWLRDVQPCDHGPAIPPSQGAAWIVLENDMAWRKMSPTLFESAATLEAHSSRVPAGRGARGHSISDPTAGSRRAAIGSDAQNSQESFFITITEGNLRNNTLYVTKVLDRFPTWAIGGATLREAADLITLMLYDGPSVQTDIVGPRKLLRTRVWGKWFKAHGVKPGDRVVFTPVDDATYFVGLARGA